MEWSLAQQSTKLDTPLLNHSVMAASSMPHHGTSEWNSMNAGATPCSFSITTTTQALPHTQMQYRGAGMAPSALPNCPCHTLTLPHKPTPHDNWHVHYICEVVWWQGITTKPVGMGQGNPRVCLCGPLWKPVPPKQVWVFGGYRSRYIQKYLGVTPM